MVITKDNKELDSLSETSTGSCYSIDFLRKRCGDKKDVHHVNKPLSLINAAQPPKKSSNSAPKALSTSYKLGRKQNLVECLEKQALFKRKRRLSNHTLHELLPSPGHRKLNTLYKSDSQESDCLGSGDHIHDSRRTKVNKDHCVYPVHCQNEPRREECDIQTFPFKTTASGNYKLKPTQVVYESKNLSIVAADPKAVTLNVTDSGKTVDNEPVKKGENENWDTKCLFTMVGAQSKVPFNSEGSETISESDGGYQTMNNQFTGKISELSLAKMGYQTDNCIDWKRFSLPQKSELQKLLLQIVLNMINTDTQVKIGNAVYKCHKIVLQCYCKYFSQKSGSQVELPESEVSKEAFTMVYQWMLHQGADSYRLLRRSNILDVFKAAQFLGIKELEDQCWAFIDNVDIFSEEKAFLLYCDARRHRNKDVMELMVPRVQRFFLTLVSSKEFVEFTSEEVCTFLRSNYICIHCEMEVFMAGVRWLSHDWAQRQGLAVQIMSCVRFGFIDPKILITLRRNPQSPEFIRVATIPEVSKMIDDGLALIILKTNRENGSDEDFYKNLKNVGLTNPVPRNWAGTDKNYKSYHEFLSDLAHYRSKQRLEIKRSRMDIELEKVNDEFLSSAVLPPATQQKIRKLQGGKSALMRYLPQLPQKDRELLKKIICEEDKKALVDDRTLDLSKKPNWETRCVKKPSGKKGSRKVSGGRKATYTQDEAAVLIQKAYRRYSLNKATKNSLLVSQIRMKSRSDPSLPTSVRVNKSQIAKDDEESIYSSPTKEAVFIFGGTNPFVALDSHENSGLNIYMYQAKTNSWRKYGELPEPRHFHSVLYFQGHVYLAGGKHPWKAASDSTALSSSVYKYDPDTLRWSSVASMIYRRRSFGLVALNGMIFAVGGRDEKDRILNSVERYDPTKNQWEEVRSMHTPRAGAGICEFNGRIWAAGGIVNGDTNSTTAGVEYYNYEHNMWIQSTNLPYTTAYATMLTIHDQLLLVGGAIGLQDNPTTGSSKQIEVWDPDEQSWCLASVMKVPRHAHSATVLRGHVFIMGGMSTNRDCVLDSVECWRAGDDVWLTGLAPLPLAVSGLGALTLPVNTFR